MRQILLVATRTLGALAHCPGDIGELRLSDGPGVRNDYGVESGSEGLVIMITRGSGSC
jgi:hypothetical protein